MKIDKRTLKGKEYLADIGRDTRFFQQAKIDSCLEKAAKLILDPKREERRNDYVCRLCTYTEVFAGSAMTGYLCEVCQSSGIAGSTNTPKLCKDCARDNGLCRKCGLKQD